MVLKISIVLGLFERDISSSNVSNLYFELFVLSTFQALKTFSERTLWNRRLVPKPFL